MRRRFTAALNDQRCVADVTLRGDSSPGQCMRKAFKLGLCRQHLKLQWFCVECGGKLTRDNDGIATYICHPCQRLWPARNISLFARKFAESPDTKKENS